MEELLERLKEAQRQILVAAASSKALPSDGTLRKVADLEQAIAAVEALLDGA